jgi:hypothetical protein
MMSSAKPVAGSPPLLSSSISFGMTMVMAIASVGRPLRPAASHPDSSRSTLVACPALEIDIEHRQCRIGGQLLSEGDFLSLDGNTGAVYPGRLEPLIEHPAAALAMIALWKSPQWHNEVAIRTPKQTATI